ncbi:type I restriction endonuclease [Mesobacillus sp. AQ2]|uniref:type I restriction endonuclease n=1 Tax=Bacillaceae TaxID=186817 RepID=UPI0011A540E2|nr:MULTISPECIES: type I restriction endonuclease [Bacillaceae]MCM3124656.1 type I restriction endonuclease [Mesobacillus sp. MER 33]MCM3234634.1 type I restriction endonuclease [Mesobacillus sp. MER 48]WHX41572.1 type I restriction endonuclease [Mesobacillus sp. AQ2]
MDNFIEQIKTLSNRVTKLQTTVVTEEATKTSIIMPFFQILGYDIFNPEEFTPEFVADVGIKKGEKVDYAIMNEGKPVILIEAKSINEKLQKHDSQLFRYFGTTSAKFAILTNGIIYRFYTDLEEQNKMDTSPFFEFNILDLKDSALIELAKFKKNSFDLENIFTTASELKYLNKLKGYLNDQVETPTEEFVKFMISQIYEGVKTKNTLEKFEPIIKKAFKQFINELVNDKLNAALKTTNSEVDAQKEASATSETIKIKDEPQVATTEEEIEGFAIVKILIKDTIAEERISYRDNLSYFNILLDNSIRKWVCRLGFNSANKYIQFNDDERTTVNIDKVSDITKYKDKLIEISSKYN